MLLPYAALRPSNLVGTREALRLALAGRPKLLHHASTLSVFVATDHGTGLFRESDHLDAATKVHGGYAATKWAAEALLRSTGLDSIVHYRLGLVTGDSRTGRASATDFLALFLRGIARLGAVPRRALAGLAVDVTPVDHAAAAMAALSLAVHAGAAPRTFHIANPQSLSLAALVETTVAAGVRLAVLDDAAWAAHLAARGAPAAADEAAARLALCRCLPAADAFARHRSLDLFQATATRFATDAADAVLAGHDLRCPAPDRALLRRYLDQVFAASRAP
jgi:thioester reductase-like protein